MKRPFVRTPVLQSMFYIVNASAVTPSAGVRVISSQAH